LLQPPKLLCAAPEIVRSAATAVRAAAAPALARAKVLVGGGASAAERLAALIADSSDDEAADGEDEFDAADRQLKAPTPLSCFQRSPAGKAAAADCGDAHATTFQKVTFACTAPIFALGAFLTRLNPTVLFR
jgi:hypothetical protein